MLAPHRMLAAVSDREVLNALPLAALLVDAADRVVFANAGAESLFARTAESLCRQGLAELFGGEPAIEELIARVRRSHGAVAMREISLVSGSLAGRRADIQAAPLAEHANHVLLLIEERHLPQMVRRQATMEGAARSVFGLAAMLAHEIKNPLSGIRGAAQLLEKSASDADASLAFLIREEVDRIRRLVDQLESFTDSRPFAKSAVNIHTVLDHVRGVAASGADAGLIFRTDFDPSLPPVIGDRDRLVQIFLNLVKNAIEALEGNGEIRLRTAFRQGLKISGPGGESVDLPIEVTVEDTGPGVPAELVDHVFEPFVSAREGGSGLGLAMVAKLVAEHDGLVEVDNGPAGAVFRVLLRAARMEAGDG